MSTPAGWYDDGSGRQRWWDGTQWTDHFADAAQAGGGEVAQSAAGSPGATLTAAPPAAAFAAPAAATAVAAPKTKPSAVGIIALVVSAIGFIFACIPGALIVGWILLPIGFILSLVAVFLKGAKWPAITGLVLAIVGTVVGFVVFFTLMANAANAAFSEAGLIPDTDTDSSISEPEGGPEEPAAASDFAVVIGESAQTEDYEGKAALVVTFTFTNNSADDANFMFAVSPKAFQDGVELENAILLSDDFDLDNALKDVKPGVSLDVQWAYVLDGTSDVTVEVTELISFDDTILATKTFSVG
ncbi:DUF5067 domain-containing protein [Microbacterium sp.]|uniref:DUF5067 domain-containing protein n=1 Tax=Microbacterium sp. TaxID=51671 RepID=UPI0037C71CC2